MRDGFKKFRNNYKLDQLAVGDLIVVNELPDTFALRVTGDITTTTCTAIPEPFRDNERPQEISRGSISGIQKQPE